MIGAGCNTAGAPAPGAGGRNTVGGSSPPLRISLATLVQCVRPVSGARPSRFALGLRARVPPSAPHLTNGSSRTYGTCILAWGQFAGFRVYGGAVLRLYRRHRLSCSHKSERYRRCQCPIYVEGSLAGEQVRKSLDLKSWEAASDLVAKWNATGQKFPQLQMRSENTSPMLKRGTSRPGA